MNTDSPIIEIQNLSRRYGKLDAVNGLSLTVRAGKCYGFFGRNGAGKTTTIKCLLNLLRPDSGAVRVFGLDPRKDEVAIKSRTAQFVLLSDHGRARFQGIVEPKTAARV